MLILAKILDQLTKINKHDQIFLKLLNNLNLNLTEFKNFGKKNLKSN